MIDREFRAKGLRAIPARGRLFFRDIRQQSNEPGTQDSLPDGALIDGRGSGPTPGEDTAFPVNQLFQRFGILVVHVNGTWNHPIGTESALQFPFKPCPLFADLADIRLRVTSHSPYLKRCQQILSAEETAIIAEKIHACNCSRGRNLAIFAVQRSATVPKTWRMTCLRER